MADGSCATVSVAGLMASAVVERTVIVAAPILPALSTTEMVPVPVTVVAVNIPVVVPMEPMAELLNVQKNGEVPVEVNVCVPLLPVTPNTCALAGVTVSPLVEMNMLALPRAPKESVAVTTTVPAVLPAVNVPSAATTLARAVLFTVQVYAPVPPIAENFNVAFLSTEATDGLRVIFAT